MCPKTYFGQNLVVFGPKILIFIRGRKNFGTHITFALFIGRAWHQMRQKRQDLAQNDHKCIFLGLICFFGPKILIFFGRKQKFQYPRNGKTTWAPCSHCFLAGHGTIWAKFGIAIFVDRAFHQYTLQLSHCIGTAPKKIVGLIPFFGVHPEFSPFLGSGPPEGQLTYS